MKTDAVIINVILDAGRGEVSPQSLEGTVGEALGKLPIPTRRGYDFAGWYLDGALVTEDSVVDRTEDVTLVAKWVKKAKEVKEAKDVKGTKDKKKSSHKRQQIAAVALALVAVIMIGTLIFVNYIVDIYPVVDTYYNEAGEIVEQKYYLRKDKNGVYGMYRSNGTLLNVNKEGYYVADVSGNQYEVHPVTGKCEPYALVDYDPEKGELLGYSDRVMLFPQIEQDFIHSIQVKNAHDSYRFFRSESGAVQLSVDGYNKTVSDYNKELYAYLSVACGYTLSTQRIDADDELIPRLADGSVDYGSFGLADRYDESGALVYTPTVYTISKLNTTVNEKGKEVVASYTPAEGKTYTVKVGDRTPTGEGYYAQFEGRETIYVLDAGLEDSLLLPAVDMVTPYTTYPLSLSTAYMVYNFELARFKDWLAEGDAFKDPENSQPIVMFSYADLSARENTVYTVVPYMTELELMSGYTINDEAVSTALTRLQTIEIMGCRALGLTEENLKAFGLDKNVHYLAFQTPVSNTETDKMVQSAILISQKTERGTYYVASYLYDMIVEVDQYYFDFLERQDKDWYAQYFISQNIAYVDYMKMELEGKEIEFTLDNTLSYAYYFDANGKVQLVKRTNGSIGLLADGTYRFRPTTGGEFAVYLIDFENGNFGLNKSGQVVYKINGQELIIEPDASNLFLYSPQYYKEGAKNPNRLNYTITHPYINDRGEERVETIYAEDNFRKFWIQDWYWLSLEGDIDRDEFFSKTGMTVEDYIAQGEDVCYATITVHVKDKASAMNQYYEDGKKLYTEDNERYLIYRFYRYTDYKAMVTVEEVTSFSEDGTPLSNPNNVRGRFYVLTSHLDTMFEDLQKVINEERVARD